MNKYLCRVQLTSLVYYLQAKNEEEAKIKVQKEMNKLNHRLLLDIPLESSEDKIISISNENLR